MYLEDETEDDKDEEEEEEWEDTLRLMLTGCGVGPFVIGAKV